MLSQDCFYFKLGEKCVFEKEKNVKCRCQYFRKIRKKLLLVSVFGLERILDLQKSLPKVRTFYSFYFIVLLTNDNFISLFKDDIPKNIDRLIPFKFPEIEALRQESFDVLACLDTDRNVVGFTEGIKFTYRLGFKFDSSFGSVIPVNKKAEIYYFSEGLRSKARRKKALLQFLGIPT